ncbi:hypothetical protein Q2T42_24885 [Leptolyngbya boryana CZ1]|uniref:Uncharacterized protein n=1 Tax=Leptolyngbya boryana CZ1 TaxID=3060204 RepID=A0AA96WVJ5_LEPBY|nr:MULTISPECIES: hypothetical protein [Leptolyngbya]MBN8559824.1 hypothetical protein [Leptolyngbya sp. UWPOB_LEPTO1]WNZ45029.1 hypothetical protein Q2T42_24885 [Leptolyngbya boryana CZ1]
MSQHKILIRRIISTDGRSRAEARSEVILSDPTTVSHQSVSISVSSAETSQSASSRSTSCSNSSSASS